jgi:membrane-associated phospholipid phosphatase
MTVLLVVAGLGVAAALMSFAMSASRQIHVDPIDPEASERAVRRGLRHHPKVRRFLHERTNRESAGGYLLTASFVVVLAATLAIGALLAMIDGSERLREIDDSVSEWGAAHATSRSVDVVRIVTNFGTSWIALSVLAIVAAVDFSRRRNREVVWFMASVGLGVIALNNLVKLLVHRDRPDVLHLMGASGYSFPSGHTATAAACWSAVALVLGRDRPRPVRAALAAGAALIAMTVATSRALLGVHWVSDVLGGLALGWAWFLLVAIVFGGRRQRLGDPVATASTPSGAPGAPVHVHHPKVDA